MKAKESINMYLFALRTPLIVHNPLIAEGDCFVSALHGESISHSIRQYWSGESGHSYGFAIIGKNMKLPLEFHTCCSHSDDLKTV